MNQDAAGKELAEIINQAKPGHPVRKWLVGAIIFAIAGGVYWHFSSSTAKDSGPVYDVENVTRGDLSLVITATGNLAPTNQVTVGSELSGTIAEVYVDLNDTVKKGQPIAKLDTTKITQVTEHNRAIVLSAKAKVSQAEATVVESGATFARFEELHRLSEGKTPSKADMDGAIATVDRANADLESAKAAVAQAEADLKSTESDLSKTIIRSPVDGIVLNRTVEVGQTVAASFTAPVLFLIAEDLRKMDLVVAVAEPDIGRLANGQPATFKVDAWPSRTYTAAVTRVSYGSVVANNVVTYNTKLAVANEDLSLRPGMTATADISVAKSEGVLLVPNAALRFDPVAAEALGKSDQPAKTLVQSLSPGGGRRWGQGPPAAKLVEPAKSSRVWTLRDGKPVEMPVKIGLTDGRHTEVAGEGLEEGTPIIVTAQPAATP